MHSSAQSSSVVSHPIIDPDQLPGSDEIELYHDTINIKKPKPLKQTQGYEQRQTIHKTDVRSETGYYKVGMIKTLVKSLDGT